MNWKVLWRRSHRWGAIVAALPFLLVLITGLMLQVKKQWAWVQPPTARGRGTAPTLSLEAILSAASAVPQAGIRGWGDVDRIDVQPQKGMAKVHAASRWEVQVDLSTGEVLHTAYRRSDIIEALHDGSWFHELAKLWVFLPVAFVVLGLWLTGAYLFFLPIAVRRAKRKP